MRRHRLNSCDTCPNGWKRWMMNWVMCGCRLTRPTGSIPGRVPSAWCAERSVSDYSACERSLTGFVEFQRVNVAVATAFFQFEAHGAVDGAAFGGTARQWDDLHFHNPFSHHIEIFCSTV